MTTTTTAAVERMHRDLFPCDVTLDGHVVATNARVFVTSGRLLVYKAEERRCVLAFQSPLQRGAPEIQRDRASLVGRLEVSTSSGVVYLNRSRGCGCGSPLRVLPRPVGW